MSLTITGKLVGTVSGTTVQNATSTFTPSTHTGTELHQTVYLSTGTSAVALPVGSVDTSANYYVLLRSLETGSETWGVSFDAGSTTSLQLKAGSIAVLPVIASEAVHIVPSASGIRIEVVVAES